MPGLCESCHDPVGKGGHAPAARGDCMACHLPHHGRLAGLLPDRADRVCFTCHADIAERLAGGVAHDPAAEGDCLLCHQPHESDHPSLLTQAMPAVCLDCHDGDDVDFRRLHLNLAGEKLDCRKCHDAHASPATTLMHERAHDPFQERDCAVCHPEAEEGGSR